MTLNESCYVLVTKMGLGHPSSCFSGFEGVVRLRGETVGAVVYAIVVDAFRGEPFIESLESMIRTFAECMAPRVKPFEMHDARNRPFEHARDLLLPRFESGEGEV